jgi:hypothetical protein
MLTAFSVLHVFFFIWSCSDAVFGTRPRPQSPHVKDSESKEWVRQIDKEEDMTVGEKEMSISKPPLANAPWMRSDENLLNKPRPLYAMQNDAERSSLSLSIFATEPEAPPVPLLKRSASRSSQKSNADSIHALPSLPPPVPQLHLDKRHKQKAQPAPRGAPAIRTMAHPPSAFSGYSGSKENLPSSTLTSQHPAPSLRDDSKALPSPPPPQADEDFLPNMTSTQIPPWPSRSLSPLRESVSSLQPPPNQFALRVSNAISMQYAETAFSTRRNSADLSYYGESNLSPSPINSRPSSPTESYRRHSLSESFSQLSTYPEDDGDDVSMIQSIEFKELPRQSFGSMFSSNWMPSLSRDSLTSAKSRPTTLRYPEQGFLNVLPMPSSNRTSMSGKSEARKSAGPSNLKD